jgi:class 3 adenylate cyclase
MPAERVGDLLDRLYDKLDAAAAACGVTKVDTIGDAYLCATNLAGDQVLHSASHARAGLTEVWDLSN